MATTKHLKNSKDKKAAKKAEVVKQLSGSGIELLGEVITWNAKGEAVHTFKSVVNALADSDLNKEEAKAILPKHAFTRAARKLTDDRVIDVLSEDPDVVTFQFTKKQMQSDEWKYSTETTLQLHKESGKVRCPIANLQEYAQKEVERCIEERTTSDITKIVQALFEANADLFPVRDQGGVYFVPKAHTAFVDKIESFLVRLGGRISRFPVPAGIGSADKSVKASIAEALQTMIDEHKDATATFTLHTRKDTMEHAADRIKKTRVKVEAYAHYLNEERERLLKELEDADNHLRKQIEDFAAARPKDADGKETTVPRDKLWDFSVTAVIRWMGKERFSFEQCRTALAKQKITVADATIRAQLLAGRKGERGIPASLTAFQEKELRGL